LIDAATLAPIGCTSQEFSQPPLMAGTIEI